MAILSVFAFLASWSPYGVMLYGGLIAVAAVAVSGRVPRLRTPDNLAVILAVWVFATLLWTSNLQTSAIYADMYASACVLFIAVRHIVVEGRAVLAVGCSYLLGSALTSVQLIHESLSTGAPARTSVETTVRFGVAGVNINYTAYSLVIGVLLAVLLLSVEGLGAVLRVSMCLLVGLLTYGVMLTGTKGAIAGLVLVAGYSLAHKVAPRLVWPVVVAAVPILLFLVPLGIAGDGSLLWLDSIFGHNATGDMSGRLLTWPYALSMWSQSIIIGNGAGIFPSLNPYRIGAHSLLLALGNDVGLVGVVVYASVFVSALVKPACLRSGRRLVGTFLVGLLPIWLTGQWEISYGTWIVLGLYSTCGGLGPSNTLEPQGSVSIERPIE